MEELICEKNSASADAASRELIQSTLMIDRYWDEENANISRPNHRPG